MCGKKIRVLFMLAVSIVVLLTSCKQEYLENISHENSTYVEKIEKSKPITIELPIKLDSSAYLIYPIRELVTANKRSLKSSYESGTRHTGYYTNLIFQNINTEKTHFLTSTQIKIKSYEQLYDTQRRAEKIMIYQIIDHFSKNEEDLIYTSLYLSSNDGGNFQKISKVNEHVKNWKYISEIKKVYFKTIEDSDRNNELNRLDKEHFYSVSILNFKVTEILKGILTE